MRMIVAVLALVVVVGLAVRAISNPEEAPMPSFAPVPSNTLVTWAPGYATAEKAVHASSRYGIPDP